MHIINEYYHIYNRGAHKAPIFHDKSDYERFTALLYVMNDTPIHRIDLRNIKPWCMFNYERKLLVHIFCYCLMPNHFHLGLTEIQERGIERFVHKLCTAYATYYNKKYAHSGTIFQGQYKSKHVDTDEYLRYLIQYIHLNPFGIEEPDMTKVTKIEHFEEAHRISKQYEYSSYKDYLDIPRIKHTIIQKVTQGRPA